MMGQDDNGREDDLGAQRYARENYSSPDPHRDGPTKRGSPEPDTDDWERILTPYDQHRKTEPRDPSLREPAAYDRDRYLSKDPEASPRTYHVGSSAGSSSSQRRYESAEPRHDDEGDGKPRRHINWAYLIGALLVVLLVIMFFLKQV